MVGHLVRAVRGAAAVVRPRTRSKGDRETITDGTGVPTWGGDLGVVVLIVVGTDIGGRPRIVGIGVWWS